MQGWGDNLYRVVKGFLIRRNLNRTLGGGAGGRETMLIPAFWHLREYQMQKVGLCLVSSQKSEKAHVAGEEGAKGETGGSGGAGGTRCRSYRASSARLSLLTFLNPLRNTSKSWKLYLQNTLQSVLSHHAYPSPSPHYFSPGPLPQPQLDLLPPLALSNPFTSKQSQRSF